MLRAQLTELNRPFIHEHCHQVAQTAADKHWSHRDYLTKLVASEAAARADRQVQRRVRDALSHRYERGATLITTNRVCSQIEA